MIVVSQRRECERTAKKTMANVCDALLFCIGTELYACALEKRTFCAAIHEYILCRAQLHCNVAKNIFIAFDGNSGLQCKRKTHTHLAHQHAMAMGIYIYIYSNDTSRRMHPDDKPDMLNSMLTGFYLLLLLLFFSTIYFVSCAR